MLWGAVNLFHRASTAQRELTAMNAQRISQKEQDGSEVKWSSSNA